MPERERFPEQPQLHSISTEEFRAGNDESQLYKVGDRITRANFVNFLIHSFAISRGNKETQMDFLLWLKARTGFDFHATMTNFIEAGGWHSLSDDEKTEFEHQFGKVKPHTDKWMEWEFEDEFINELESVQHIGEQLDMLDKKGSLKDKGFAEMDYEKFREYANKQIKEWHKSREGRNMNDVGFKSEQPPLRMAV